MGRGKARDGQYVPLPYAQIKSDAWRALSGSAVKLWLELHTRYNCSNNGTLTLSYAEAGQALGMGKATVQRAYQELVAHGFLALAREGNWYHRRAHEWRLTTKPVHLVRGKQPPTHDWRSWHPGKTERGTVSEPSGSSVVPFENPAPVPGSRSEPVSANLGRAVGSESEHS